MAWIETEKKNKSHQGDLLSWLTHIANNVLLGS